MPNALERGTTEVTTTAANIDFNADGGSVLVEITGASSWDGTVDFEATPDGVTFYNIPYVRRDQIDLAPSVAQISSPSTAILYELMGPLHQIRINCGAGTTGTLTVVHRVMDKNSASRAVVGAQGMAADDAVAVGNPVQMGGVAIEVDSSDPGAVAAGDAAYARMDLNRRTLVNPVHPNYFNVYTAITTVDSDTAVVPAGGTGLRTFITDIVIQSNQTAGLGSWTLTNDAGTAILGPLEIVDQVAFVAHFVTPLVNETANDQVEFDKTAGEDDWEVYLAGYYAP